MDTRRQQQNQDARRRDATDRRATPERSLEFVHLDLPSLRAYRKALGTEEHRVSYWRRIIQARLDLVRSHRDDVPTMERLQDAFAEERPAQGRMALIAIVPDDDIPPIPDLDHLWKSSVDPDDAQSRARLERELAFAELQLSTYRQALHRRLGRATAELIARYHEDPSQCLVALPSAPGAA